MSFGPWTVRESQRAIRGAEVSLCSGSTTFARFRVNLFLPVIVWIEIQ